MAQAEHEPTAPVAETHPVPSDAELVKSAYEAMCDLEEPLYDIRDFAEALQLMAESLGEPSAGAVGRVARSIKETAEAIQEEREQICARAASAPRRAGDSSRYSAQRLSQLPPRTSPPRPLGGLLPEPGSHVVAQSPRIHILVMRDNAPQGHR